MTTVNGSVPAHRSRAIENACGVDATSTLFLLFLSFSSGERMKRRFRAATPPRRFRRQSHWAVMLGTALAASTTAGVQPAAGAGPSGASQGAQASGTAAQDSRQLQFQIAAGPLDAAVAEYQRVTGLKVVLSDPRIGSVQSSGAAGTLTPAAAMDAMLSGTAVRARRHPARHPRRLRVRRGRGAAREGKRPQVQPDTA
jgi:hypothetical protein